nr:reverse transcriptase domain-containing protein [Tanacetum cinerariifolium]
MFAYSNDSRRRSYHNSREDTESCYQSSRSREIEFAFEKRHNNRASSRRIEALSESEDSAGGHWKSKPKRQKSSIEDDLSQLWVCEETHPFIPRIRVPRELHSAEKCIKDPVEIHNIKQRDGESMEEFVRRYKLECRDVKGALECMKILGFMHGITNPELIKRLHDKILNSVDEMMRVTTTFLRGEVVASSRERKKSLPSWKQQEAGQKQNFKKAGFWNQQRKDQVKAEKKGETSGKDKPLTILMVHLWKRVAKQRITQTFSPKTVILFPPLREKDGTEGPMIIEAEMGRHFVHRMYVDRGSSLEILYEHCFNRFRLEVKSQMVLANTPLVRFSGEILWPLGQISLLVKIGDEEHSTSAWMNLMVVRSPSPYNEIIRKPGVRRIQAVPSTTHGMLKFPVTSGTETSAHLLRQSCITMYENQLHSNREADTCSEVTGRLLKWSFELKVHDIHYRPTTSVKGQILADFIVERPEDEPSDTPMKEEEELSDPWILFTDGSSCIDGFGAGLILTNPEGMEFTYALSLSIGNLEPFRLNVLALKANVVSLFGENRKNDAMSGKLSPLKRLIIGINVWVKLSEGENIFTPATDSYASNPTPNDLIPVEIGMPTLRTVEVDMIKNDEALEINLDHLEEKREQAAIQEAKSKAKIEKYYNARVHNTSFKLADLVYQNNEASHAKDGGKLRPKWEGPYEVTKALGKRVYKLRDHNGNILPRTWNVCNLKKCYVHRKISSREGTA